MFPSSFGKIFLNNFPLSEEITSAFPKLLGNFSWVLGQYVIKSKMSIIIK
jgi:hypothetical protein